MRRVRLICWNAADAEEKAERLRAAGYAVASGALTASGLRELRENSPLAAVIDLARQPSSGRDVGLAIRQHRATRRVPLVFVDGDPDTVTRIRELLPDAVYTTWSRISTSLKRAIAHPPDDPVVPRSSLAGYAGAPITKKLGIKADSLIVLVNAPAGFEATLGRLPEGTVLSRQSRGPRDLTLWFAQSQRDLERRTGRMVFFADRGGLWILWPKKASRIAGDLSQQVVREAGLAAGIVDYKVCAIDADWSGLRFSRRRSR